MGKNIWKTDRIRNAIISAFVFPLAGLTFAFDVTQVDDWAYQLQEYPSGLQDILTTEFDLVVIDYSQTGDSAGEWTAGEINALRTQGPCGDRIVLAYLSIGEAEDYRFYWNDSWVDSQGEPIPGVAPDWLGPQNPEWEGNYKVRYWMGAWQGILFGNSSGPEKSYLDRILSQGFDGVYLDIIDAFEYWGPNEIGGNDARRTAPADMIDLVERIHAYGLAHGTRPAFYVFPQNGSYIIDPNVYPDASNPENEANVQKQRLFSHISGIGAEDVFFTGPNEENNPYDPDWDTMATLNQFRDAGKKVLSIEYLTQPALIQAYYTSYAPAQSYVPYATVRALDQLTINTGFEPDCESAATPTPVPCTQLGVTIRMPAHTYREGDICFCRIDVCNPGPETYTCIPLFVILDAFGTYFFAPAFSDFDYYNQETLQTGTATIEVIPEFRWPGGTGTVNGIVWYAAMTDSTITALFGEMDSWVFGWSTTTG